APRRGCAAHRRAAAGAQRVWIAFGGGADLPWQRLLRPGFRHCFAAIADDGGWLVLDPLAGRLVAARLDLPPGYDLPGFYRRAGLRVIGPFTPAEPRRTWLPALRPLSCVGLCRAVLGPGAPWAVTPHGLYRALGGDLSHGNRKNVLTTRRG
ncbi:MAG: hypothetical protein K2X74_14990, partial [Acetobacteraceae bacterium]|nr:hypothetical protein [Acetobacteraceae bacterium]